jgi:hypothetical protein
MELGAEVTDDVVAEASVALDGRGKHDRGGRGVGWPEASTTKASTTDYLSCL